MFVLLFLAFLASTSASEPVGCRKKISFGLFETEHPVKGNCEETGLGWTGRRADLIKEKDQFFTKWTDFFLQPECVDKIFAFVSDNDGRNEQLIETKENFPKIIFKCSSDNAVVSHPSFLCPLKRNSGLHLPFWSCWASLCLLVSKTST